MTSQMKSPPWISYQKMPLVRLPGLQARYNEAVDKLATKLWYHFPDRTQHPGWSGVIIYNEIRRTLYKYIVPFESSSGISLGTDQYLVFLKPGKDDSTSFFAVCMDSFLTDTAAQLVSSVSRDLAKQFATMAERISNSLVFKWQLKKFYLSGKKTINSKAARKLSRLKAYSSSKTRFTFMYGGSILAKFALKAVGYLSMIDNGSYYLLALPSITFEKFKLRIGPAFGSTIAAGFMAFAGFMLTPSNQGQAQMYAEAQEEFGTSSEISIPLHFAGRNFALMFLNDLFNHMETMPFDQTIDEKALLEESKKYELKEYKSKQLYFNPK